MKRNVQWLLELFASIVVNASHHGRCAAQCMTLDDTEQTNGSKAHAVDTGDT